MCDRGQVLQVKEMKEESQSLAGVLRDAGVARVADRLEETWLPRLAALEGKAVAGCVLELQPEVAGLLGSLRRAREGCSYPGHTASLAELLICLERSDWTVMGTA